MGRGEPNQEVAPACLELCDECGDEALTQISIRVYGRDLDKSLCVAHLEDVLRFARPLEEVATGKRV